MCGIVGYLGKNRNALDTIISGLEALEYRGYDSAGIAYVYKNQIQIKKKAGRISNLKEILNFSETPFIGIGHTRWATHGEPNETNAHPHHSGKFTIVHNGIIENYIDLKNMLEKKGVSFSSETDTEVACALLNDIYKTEKDILKTLVKAQDLLIGSYAFGILCEDDLNTIYAMRKSSPLIVATKDNDKFIASDVPAILSFTNEYYLLDDFDIAILKEDTLSFYHPKKEFFQKEKLLFEGSKESSQKDGYEHFMLKEIHEQPKVIKDTIHFYFDGTKESLFANLPDLEKYQDIHIVACG